MEPLLMLVTVVALVLGAVMSAVAWKLLRYQRVQSAARVEALQAMASAEEDAEPPMRAVPARPAPPAARAEAAAISTAPPAPARFSTLEDAPLERPAPPVAAPGGMSTAQLSIEEADWDAMRSAPGQSNPGASRTTAASSRTSEIHVRFGAADEPRAPARRWIALAGVAAMMALGIGAVYGAYATDLFAAFGRATTATASTAPNAVSDPLQLLSLKHVTDESGTFTLTGLVQNPASGRPLRGVVAVVYLFDQEGRYFTGGKTALDLTALHPGEESPFVVKVPAATGVTRYRIGFRMDDGGVVAHVDRRGQLPGGTLEDARDEDDTVGALVSPPLGPRRSEG